MSKKVWKAHAGFFFLLLIVLLFLITDQGSPIHLAIKGNILATHLLWFPIALYMVEMLLQYIFAYYTDPWYFTRFIVNFAGYPVLFLNGLYIVALLKLVYIDGYKRVPDWSCKLFCLAFFPSIANVGLFYLAIIHDQNEIEELSEESENGEIVRVTAFTMVVFENALAIAWFELFLEFFSAVRCACCCCSCGKRSLKNSKELSSKKDGHYEPSNSSLVLNTKVVDDAKINYESMSSFHSDNQVSSRKNSVSRSVTNRYHEWPQVK